MGEEFWQQIYQTHFGPKGNHVLGRLNCSDSHSRVETLLKGTLHMKLQKKFQQKSCSENSYSNIKLLKKSLWLGQKIVMCMEDNCIFAFLCVVCARAFRLTFSWGCRFKENIPGETVFWVVSQILGSREHVLARCLIVICINCFSNIWLDIWIYKL